MLFLSDFLIPLDEIAFLALIVQREVMYVMAATFKSFINKMSLDLTPCATTRLDFFLPTVWADNEGHLRCQLFAGEWDGVAASVVLLHAAAPAVARHFRLSKDTGAGGWRGSKKQLVFRRALAKDVVERRPGETRTPPRPPPLLSKGRRMHWGSVDAIKDCLTSCVFK